MAHRLPLADIQFIADFAAYARGRGGDGYDYFDTNNCALCQMARDMLGYRNPGAGGNYWHEYGGGERTHLPVIASEVVVAPPHTFSALADRLEALIADAPAVRQA